MRIDIRLVDGQDREPIDHPIVYIGRAQDRLDGAKYTGHGIAKGVAKRAFRRVMKARINYDGGR